MEFRKAENFNMVKSISTKVFLLEKSVEQKYKELLSAMLSMKEELLREVKTTKRETAEEVRKAISLATEKFHQQLEASKKQHQEEIQDVRTSLEFSQHEILELKKVVETNTAALKSLTAQLNTETEKAVRLEAKCEDLERHSRGFNLRFVGVKEDREENCVELIEKLCSTEMGLSVKIENAHRVGKSFNERPRQIIARFLFRPQRQQVLLSGRKLRGTDIFVNEDLPPKEAAKKRSLLPIFKKARADGRKAYFRGCILFLDDIKYA